MNLKFFKFSKCNLLRISELFEINVVKQMQDTIETND